MQALLNNDCIDYIELDEGSGNCEGWIYFVGGQMYAGEIQENLPHGNGMLKLKDGSNFKGNFENGKFCQGYFKHISGIKFEGKFNKDRLQKGKILFLDGEYLEGNFSIKRNKWMLKKGNYYGQDGDLIQKLNEKNSKIESKLKIIEGYNLQLGSYIELEYFYFDINQPWVPFRIHTDLSSFYQIEKDSQVIKKFQNVFQIMYNKEEIYEDQDLISQKYEVFLGHQINLEQKNNQKNWILQFKNLSNVLLKGDFSFKKLKFHFKGNLYINNIKESLIEIQTLLLGKLLINYQQKTFKKTKDFLHFLITEYPQIKQKEIQRKKHSNLFNNEAMSGILEDLKNDEQCMIF